ncbi:hypothetical protein pipiens_001730 [Culex pipiens pipiens]|uniref:Uncharacterized protein n=1 Tax=Culex pipiens pipiens TaxID=38569 RepID=A0ABD1DYF2_CULPP
MHNIFFKFSRPLFPIPSLAPTNAQMINPGGSSSGGGNNTIVSSAPSNSNKWITSICSAATSLTVASIGTPPTSVPPTPVGIMASSSVVAAAAQGGNLGRPPSTRLYKDV